MDTAQLWTAAATIGGIAAAILFVPVIFRWLQIGKQGTERVQELDSQQAETKVVAESGGNTLLALAIALVAFGIPVSVIFWVQSGRTFLSYPLLVAVVGIVNWLFTLIGIGPVIAL